MPLVDYFLAGAAATAGALALLVPTIVVLTLYFRWLESDQNRE